MLKCNSIYLLCGLCIPSDSVLYSTFRLFLIQDLPPVCPFKGYILNITAFLYFLIWLLCSIHSTLIIHLECFLFENQTLSNILFKSFLFTKIFHLRTREVAHWLRALATLVEDLGLIPSTHVCLQLTRYPLLTSTGAGYTCGVCTYKPAKYLNT